MVDPSSRSRSWAVSALAAFGLAGASCNLYSDTDQPVPSSSWTWVCDDGALAPDAGCSAGEDQDGGATGDNPG
jgi:hypothetical protein